MCHGSRQFAPSRPPTKPIRRRKDAVLFIGSSSIRRWTTLAADFPGTQGINRGFGGSHSVDSVAFADRIVTPYQPKLVLLYAGDNDIASGKSPERSWRLQGVRGEDSRGAAGHAHCLHRRSSPCPSREKFLDQVKTANRLIREYCGDGRAALLFVDVFTPMLAAEGRPRADLCVKDMLHLNAQGYELWASILRPVLDKYDPPGTAAEAVTR